MISQTPSLRSPPSPAVLQYRSQYIQRHNSGNIYASPVSRAVATAFTTPTHPLRLSRVSPVCFPAIQQRRTPDSSNPTITATSSPPRPVRRRTRPARNVRAAATTGAAGAMTAAASTGSPSSVGTGGEVGAGAACSGDVNAGVGGSGVGAGVATNRSKASAASAVGAAAMERVEPHVRRKVCALYAQAKQAQRAGDFSSAQHILHQGLQLDPRDAHSWLALAQLHTRSSLSSSVDLLSELSSSPLPSSQSKTDRSVQSTPVTTKDIDASSLLQGGKSRIIRARQTFQLALHHCPSNVHLLHAWAMFEHRAGNTASARELFASAFAIDPVNPYVCHAWGLLEQRTGNSRAARDLFAKAVANRPNAEVCVAWAIMEGRDGRIDEARSIFRKGLVAAEKAKNPAKTRADVYRVWAEIEERVGDFSKARELLNKAMSCQPSHVEAYVALAKLEARRGGSTRAVELLRAAVELSPKPPAAVFVAWAHIELTTCRRPEEARKVLQRGIALHRKDPAMLQMLGTVEERSGNLGEAKRQYRASVSARPTAPAYVAWALLEERQTNFDASQRLFEEALTTDALHGVAYNAYGMMEARRGDLDAARKVFDRGVKASASASVFHGYGMLELRMGGNVDKAREMFRKGAMQSRVDTSFIWHSWGMLELGQDNVESAREVFLEGIKRYPRSSQMLVGAALAFAACCPGTLADDGRTRTLFRQAVGADPTHAHGWQAWGVFELRRGRVDAAIALFRRGLRMCPSHGALWQAWGVLETGKGDFGRARQLFQRGAQVCPDHVHLLQAWACMEVRAMNIERARELLDAALASDGDHGPVWNAYGLLEARHGTLAKARQNFTTGIRRAPRHAPLYRTFGQAEARAGNYERARELFRDGLLVDPRHAPLYHAAAQLEAMLGNLDGLAELRGEAERYFGSKGDAERALDCGDGGRASDASSVTSIGDPVDDGVIEQGWNGVSTPMELALGEGDLTFL